MIEADLYPFLQNHKWGVLSTTNERGTPQSAVMGIAITPQLEIVFDTVKSSRKYPNLVGRPACSLVIGGWDNSQQTVQYEGQAEELRSPMLESYLEVYFRAFPDGPARMNWPGMVYFVVRPKWIRYSDFRAGSRTVQEFSIAAR